MKATSIAFCLILLTLFVTGRTRTWKDYYNKASDKFKNNSYSSAYSAINQSFSLLPDTTCEFFKENDYRNVYIVDSLYFMRAVIKTIIGDSSAVSDFFRMKYFSQCLLRYHDSLEIFFPLQCDSASIETFNSRYQTIRDPDIVQTLIATGEYFEFDKKSFLKAKRCFQMVSVLQPDSAYDSDYACYKLSELASLLNRNKYCIEVSKQFLSRFSNTKDTTLISSVYNNVLNSMFNLRKYGDVVFVIDKMITKGMDKNGSLYFDRAIANLNLGNQANACVDFNTAVNIGLKVKKKRKLKKIFCT